LRQLWERIANLRPAVFYPVLRDSSPLREEIVSGTDILIVRELLGGLYSANPVRSKAEPGSRQAVNTMRYGEGKSSAFARMGFALARNRRKRLVSVDKSNVAGMFPVCGAKWSPRSGANPDVQPFAHVCRLRAP